MAAFDLLQVHQETAHFGLFGRLQGKTELGIELLERSAQHALDVSAGGLGFLQAFAQPRKGLAIGFLDAELDAGLLECVGQFRQLRLEGRRAEQVEHFPEQFQVDGTHGLYLGAAGIEFDLLLLDARTHVFDDRVVLAAQAAQLDHLLGQVAAADMDDTAGFGTQLDNAGGHRRAQDFLPLPHHALRQRQFQPGQAAGLQQLVIACDFGDQAFLGRDGNDLGHRQPENLRRAGTLAVDLGLDLRGRTQGVPQGVDLVEHHQAGIVVVTLGDQVFTPDGQVGFGHAGVGRQDENHRMGLRNQAHREFRLGADRVEPRRVENHQPLLEQRMGDVDQRMAPLGHLDQTGGIDPRIVLRRVVMPEAQRARLVLRDMADFGHLFERLRELDRVVHIEVDPCPFLGNHAPLHQGLRLEPGLDGQQAQAGRRVRVVAQLGRAHGGAAGTGRHDAPAVTGEKDRIDQLGLATRKFGNKGHHDLVRAHLRLQPEQALFHGGIEQIVALHPFGQKLEAQGKRAPPGAVLVKLFVKRHGAPWT